jgi:transglutaminase-like putative cysteine protease
LIRRRPTRTTIARIAAEIHGETEKEKLRAIDEWMKAHLRYRPEDAYAWRTADRMPSDGMYGACADHAVLFGSVARAVGIPTACVKTMDADGIREFVVGEHLVLPESYWPSETGVTLELLARDSARPLRGRSCESARTGRPSTCSSGATRRR